MKSYHNIRSSRSSVKNIQIIQGGQDLTAQAGLIPVVKFLKKHGFASKIEQTLDHQRGATGVYDAVDMILLPLVAIVGGARSISSIVTVWNDRVLCLAAGWLRIPDETTFGRILRTFRQKNSNYSGSQIIDITCNFLIIFTVNPKVPLTVSPRQFKIFAQMPKMSSWKV